MASQLETAYLELQDYLLNLEIRFIEPIDSKLIPDKEDELDMRSYCVLTHAAFEEFAETVASFVLEETIERFINFQEISFGLCTILHFNAPKVGSIDEIDITYDYISKTLKDIKSTMSTDIRMNNHGTSMKYLKKMLIPLGVSIPSDAYLSNSLEQLASHRGAFAHSFSKNRIKLLPSPSDLKKYVEDVTVIMGKIYQQVDNIKFFKYKLK